MKLEAAVLNAVKTPFELREIEMDPPGPNEVVVRIVSSGICHTDLARVAAADALTRPVVLGHEGAGVVELIGSDVSQLSVGNHVVLSFDSCGNCDCCRRGRPTYCRNFMAMNFSGTRLDGTRALKDARGPLDGHFFGQSSFATYSLASERNAIKVSKELPLELLGPLGCGLQTGAGAVMNVFAAPAGSSLAVFGAGAVGLSAVMAAAASGCGTIVAVDIRESRLETALKVGATHVIDGSKQDATKAILELTRTGANYSFDTTGATAVIRQAIECLDEQGTCGVVAGSGMEFPPRLRGRSVRGIIEGDAVPHVFIPLMIDLLQKGRFPFERLIGKFPFPEINEAAAASLDGSVIKPVLTF